MSEDFNSPDTDDQDAFKREAEGERIGLAAEFWDFLKYNKKWWLLPIVVVMLLIGLLVAIGSSAAAPFIYPLF
ncbi:MAG: DUF5989 family protein [Planctomycetota bacterium]|nr:DUF5989 family protein [Planctomycetota bacterium]MCZ6817297.1 DUF5989 family protein [Planctomycetota bacterium]